MRSGLRCSFASHVAVLTAVVSLDRKTAVGPELSLGCGNHAVPAAMPPAGRREWDRSKESDEAPSREHACGSRSEGLLGPL